MDDSTKLQIDRICENVSPIEVIPEKYEFTSNFFTSLFIKIKKNQNLKNFRNNFYYSFDEKVCKEFSPHVSLTYGNFFKKNKIDFINKLHPLRYKFTLNKICIVDVNEDIFSWNIIKTYFL